MPNLPKAAYGNLVTPVESGAGPISGASTPAAEAMSKLGGQLQELGGYLHDTYVQTRATNRLAESQKQLQDFVYKLQNGERDPETGEMKPPPAPDLHEELYRQEVERVRKEAEDDLGGGKALQLYDQETNQFTQRQLLTVKQHALDRYHAEIKVNVDDTLQKKADLSVNSDPLTRTKIHDEALGEIDRAVMSGVMTPEEGAARKKNFVHDVAVGTISKMMRDPNGGPSAAALAIQRGEFADLPADEQQRWIGIALEREYTLNRRKDAEEERAERRKRRAQADLEEQTAKEAWSLYRKGALTPEWVEENAESLSKEDYKDLLLRSSGRAEVKTLPEVYSPLRIAAGSGADVREAAERAYRNGNIDRDAFEKIMGEVESNSAGAAISNSYTRGRNYLNKYLIPDENTASGFEKQVAAKMLDEWTKWSATHPEAKPAEVEAEFQRLGDEGKTLILGDLTITQPIPRYLKGGRAAIDISTPEALSRTWDVLDEAARATVDAFKKKEIDEYQRKRQMSIINKYLQSLPPRPAKATKK